MTHHQRWTAKHWPKPASGRRRGGQGRSGHEVDPAKFPARFTAPGIVRTPCAARTPQQAALYIDPLNQTVSRRAARRQADELQHATWTRTPPGAPYGIWLPPLPWP
ncbi:MAG: hypothetical protein ACLS6O_05185 [Bifidobacterium sp.]